MILNFESIYTYRRTFFGTYFNFEINYEHFFCKFENAFNLFQIKTSKNLQALLVDILTFKFVRKLIHKNDS